MEDETEAIIYLAIEVHKLLGFGFSEIVYKDALEYEFKLNAIEFQREKAYTIRYKDIYLKHKFFADFVVFDLVILEIKAKDSIASTDMQQTINYLKCSGCKVGLILNFGRNKIEIKRLVF